MLVAYSWDRTIKFFDISELPTKLPKLIQIQENLHNDFI